MDKEKDLMLYVDGNKKSFRCTNTEDRNNGEICGCNVFRKTKNGKYKCNSCGAIYVGEKENE